jgi:hypothetical protein
MGLTGRRMGENLKIQNSKFKEDVAARKRAPSCQLWK